MLVFGDVAEDTLEVGELKDLVNKPPRLGVDCQLSRAVQQVVFSELSEGPGYLASGEVSPSNFDVGTCHHFCGLRNISKIGRENYSLVVQILRDPFHELRIGAD